MLCINGSVYVRKNIFSTMYMEFALFAKFASLTFFFFLDKMLLKYKITQRNLHMLNES